MPKFYVQSGSVSLVVAAMDAEAAALWAIHQNSELPETGSCRAGLEQSAGDLSCDGDLYCEDTCCEDTCCDETAWDDLMPEWAQLDEFGDSIRVSERGLGRSEAGRFETATAMQKYGQLLVAVERLLGKLED